MIAFFTTLLRLFLQAFRSKRNILTENALLKKENEILARKMGRKRVHFDFYDNQRPHQGIRQQIPKPAEREKTGGAVRMSPVLGGLHQHYYRQAA